MGVRRKYREVRRRKSARCRPSNAVVGDDDEDDDDDNASQSHARRDFRWKRLQQAPYERDERDSHSDAVWAEYCMLFFFHGRRGRRREGWWKRVEEGRGEIEGE